MLVSGLLESFEGGAAATLSDTTADPAGPFAGFMATTAGAVKVTTVRGQTVVLSAAVGIIVEVAIQRVWSTGTAAAGVVGLYRVPFKGPGPT